jgi:hypothetical protein
MQFPDLGNEPARVVIGWCGSVVATLAAGAWAVFIYFRPRKERKPDASVKASHGGVAAGRDISDSKIEIRHDGRSD